MLILDGSLLVGLAAVITGFSTSFGPRAANLETDWRKLCATPEEA
jgi:hypothetical protein